MLKCSVSNPVLRWVYVSMLTHSLSHLPSRFRRHQSVRGPETRLVLKRGQKRDQAISISLNIYFSKFFFCIRSNKRTVSRSLLEKLHCLPLGKLVDASSPEQTHYMLHVLDSPSPSLRSLLSPSLTVRKDVRAYADAITKYSRIDSFPFSRPMKSPLL